MRLTALSVMSFGLTNIDIIAFLGLEPQEFHAARLGFQLLFPSHPHQHLLRSGEIHSILPLQHYLCNKMTAKL
jgi:hypothetical protein